MKALFLIQPRQTEDGLINTVSARDLHAFLENGTRFATWMTDQLARYDFEEGRDYVIFSENPEKRGRPRTEYALTLDTAKQLAMVDKSARGKEARRYFIECERRLFSQVPATLPEALRLAADLAEKLAVTTPKAEALERIAEADGSYCITDAAKILQVQPKRLFGYLQREGWIFRRSGNLHWTAYQSRIRSGLLEHKVDLVPGPDGEDRARTQVRITPKGMTRIAEALCAQVPEAA